MFSLSFKALEYITPIAILFLTTIPILDTMVIIRRRLTKKSHLFVADKNYIHNILYNIKRNKPFTVNTIIMIQSAFCLIFLQVLHLDDILNIVLFTILYLIFFNLFDSRGRKRDDKHKKKSKKKYIKLGVLSI